MSEETKKSFGDTDLGTCIGVAIIIIALCIGVGSCNFIQSIGDCDHTTEAEVTLPDAKTQTEAIAVCAMAIEAE